MGATGSVPAAKATTGSEPAPAAAPAAAPAPAADSQRGDDLRPWTVPWPPPAVSISDTTTSNSSSSSSSRAHSAPRPPGPVLAPAPQSHSLSLFATAGAVAGATLGWAAAAYFRQPLTSNMVFGALIGAPTTSIYQQLHAQVISKSDRGPVISGMAAGTGAGMAGSWLLSTVRNPRGHSPALRLASAARAGVAAMVLGGLGELAYVEYRRWRLQRLANMRLQELGLLPAGQEDGDSGGAATAQQQQAAALAETDGAPPTWWPTWLPIRKHSDTSERILLEQEVLQRRARVLVLEEKLRELEGEPEPGSDAP